MSIAIQPARLTLQRVARTAWGAAAIEGLEELARRGLTRFNLNQLHEAIEATGGWKEAVKYFGEIAELIS